MVASDAHVAPWSSPYCDSSDGATDALVVGSDGYWGHSFCSYSYALRPALKLNSNLSVSVDGDGENCGECDFDLGRINSADLLNELKRRLEDSCANSIL